MNLRNSIAGRVCAAVISIAFVTTSHFTPFSSFAYAQDVQVNTAQTAAIPADLNLIEIPKKFGTIEDVFRGKSDDLIVLIQDAHAITEAQNSIQKLIDYFQANYGVKLIAVEGASAVLDPQIFRSFPDKEILKKVFKEYFDRGELAGSVSAAIFNEHEGSYHGIEDWDLYEEGTVRFLAAMEGEKEILETLASLRQNLQKKKESHYSSELLAIDRAIDDFRRNYTNLIPVLEKLAKIRPPGKDSEMALLISEAKRNQSERATVDAEVRKVAQKVKNHIESLTPTPQTKEDLVRFNEKYQAFRTSQVSPEEFALLLKELVIQYKLKVRVSKALDYLVRSQKRMKDIQGTHLFKEFEQYAQSVKGSLFKSDAERDLDRQSHQLELLEKLAKLELNQENWKELKGLKTVPPGQNHTTPMDSMGASALLNAPDFQPNFAFYENSEKRDDSLFGNLMELVSKNPASAVSPSANQKSLNAAMMICGGFHTEGLVERLKAQNVSYVLVMPEIRTVPEETNYKDQMRGKVTWESYFEVENGRVNIYKAFVRATRDRLIQAMSGREDGRAQAQILKTWRDQIIRDLSAKSEIVRAPQYTVFLDELTKIEKPRGPPADWVKRVDRFVIGLRQLEERGELSKKSILDLLKPSGIAPEASGPVVLSSQRNDSRVIADIVTGKSFRTQYRSEVSRATQPETFDSTVTARVFELAGRKWKRSLHIDSDEDLKTTCPPELERSLLELTDGMSDAEDFMNVMRRLLSIQDREANNMAYLPPNLGHIGRVMKYMQNLIRAPKHRILAEKMKEAFGPNYEKVAIAAVLFSKLGHAHRSFNPGNRDTYENTRAFSVEIAKAFEKPLCAALGLDSRQISLFYDAILRDPDDLSRFQNPLTAALTIAIKSDISRARLTPWQRDPRIARTLCKLYTDNKIFDLITRKKIIQIRKKTIETRRGIKEGARRKYLREFNRLIKEINRQINDEIRVFIRKQIILNPEFRRRKDYPEIVAKVRNLNGDSFLWFVSSQQIADVTILDGEITLDTYRGKNPLLGAAANDPLIQDFHFNALQDILTEVNNGLGLIPGQTVTVNGKEYRVSEDDCFRVRQDPVDREALVGRVAYDGYKAALHEHAKMSVESHLLWGGVLLAWPITVTEVDEEKRKTKEKELRDAYYGSISKSEEFLAKVGVTDVNLGKIYSRARRSFRRLQKFVLDFAKENPDFDLQADLDIIRDPSSAEVDEVIRAAKRILRKANLEQISLKKRAQIRLNIDLYEILKHQILDLYNFPGGPLTSFAIYYNAAEEILDISKHGKKRLIPLEKLTQNALDLAQANKVMYLELRSNVKGKKGAVEDTTKKMASMIRGYETWKQDQLEAETSPDIPAMFVIASLLKTKDPEANAQSAKNFVEMLENAWTCLKGKDGTPEERARYAAYVESYGITPEQMLYYVRGIDAAGAEEGHPPRKFIKAFRIIRRYNERHAKEEGFHPIRITYHVSESNTDVTPMTAMRYSVEAMEKLRAERLGHNITPAVSDFGKMKNVKFSERVSERLDTLRFIRNHFFDRKTGEAVIPLMSMTWESINLEIEKLEKIPEKFRDRVVIGDIKSLQDLDPKEDAEEIQMMQELLALPGMLSLLDELKTPIVYRTDAQITDLKTIAGYTLDMVIRRGVIVETNPTSNLHISPWIEGYHDSTMAVYASYQYGDYMRSLANDLREKIAAYPRSKSMNQWKSALALADEYLADATSRGLMRRRVKATISTDDSTLMSTTYSDDVALVAEALGWDPFFLMDFMQRSFDYRFGDLPEDVQKKVDDEYRQTSAAIWEMISQPILETAREKAKQKSREKRVQGRTAAGVIVTTGKKGKVGTATARSEVRDPLKVLEELRTVARQNIDELKAARADDGQIRQMQQMIASADALRQMAESATTAEEREKKSQIFRQFVLDVMAPLFEQHDAASLALLLVSSRARPLRDYFDAIRTQSEQMEAAMDRTLKAMPQLAQPAFGVRMEGFPAAFEFTDAQWRSFSAGAREKLISAVEFILRSGWTREFFNRFKTGQFQFAPTLSIDPEVLESKQFTLLDVAAEIILAAETATQANQQGEYGRLGRDLRSTEAGLAERCPKVRDPWNADREILPSEALGRIQATAVRDLFVLHAIAKLGASDAEKNLWFEQINRDRNIAMIELQRTLGADALSRTLQGDQVNWGIQLQQLWYQVQTIAKQSMLPRFWQIDEALGEEGAGAKLEAALRKEIQEKTVRKDFRSAMRFLEAQIGRNIDEIPDLDLTPILDAVLGKSQEMIGWRQRETRATETASIVQFRNTMTGQPTTPMFFANLENWKKLLNLLRRADPSDTQTITAALEVMQVFIKYRPEIIARYGGMRELVSWLDHSERAVRETVRQILDQIQEGVEEKKPQYEGEWNPLTPRHIGELAVMMERTQDPGAFGDILRTILIFVRHGNHTAHYQKDLARALNQLRRSLRTSAVSLDAQKRNMLLRYLYPSAEGLGAKLVFRDQMMRAPPGEYSPAVIAAVEKLEAALKKISQTPPARSEKREAREEVLSPERLAEIRKVISDPKALADVLANESERARLEKDLVRATMMHYRKFLPRETEAAANAVVQIIRSAQEGYNPVVFLNLRMGDIYFPPTDAMLRFLETQGIKVFKLEQAEVQKMLQAVASGKKDSSYQERFKEMFTPERLAEFEAADMVIFASKVPSRPDVNYAAENAEENLSNHVLLSAWLQTEFGRLKGRDPKAKCDFFMVDASQTDDVSDAQYQFHSDINGSSVANFTALNATAGRQSVFDNLTPLLSPEVDVRVHDMNYVLGDGMSQSFLGHQITVGTLREFPNVHETFLDEFTRMVIPLVEKKLAEQRSESRRQKSEGAKATGRFRVTHYSINDGWPGAETDQTRSVGMPGLDRIIQENLQPAEYEAISERVTRIRSVKHLNLHGLSNAYFGEIQGTPRLLMIYRDGILSFDRRLERYGGEKGKRGQRSGRFETKFGTTSIDTPDQAVSIFRVGLESSYPSDDMPVGGSLRHPNGRREFMKRWEQFGISFPFVQFGLGQSKPTVVFDLSGEEAQNKNLRRNHNTIISGEWLVDGEIPPASFLAYVFGRTGFHSAEEQMAEAGRFVAGISGYRYEMPVFFQADEESEPQLVIPDRSQQDAFFLVPVSQFIKYQESRRKGKTSEKKAAKPARKARPEKARPEQVMQVVKQVVPQAVVPEPVTPVSPSDREVQRITEAINGLIVPGAGFKSRREARSYANKNIVPQFIQLVASNPTGAGRLMTQLIDGADYAHDDSYDSVLQPIVYTAIVETLKVQPELAAAVRDVAVQKLNDVTGSKKMIAIQLLRFIGNPDVILVLETQRGVEKDRHIQGEIEFAIQDLESLQPFAQACDGYQQTLKRGDAEKIAAARERLVAIAMENGIKRGRAVGILSRMLPREEVAIIQEQFPQLQYRNEFRTIDQILGENAGENLVRILQEKMRSGEVARDFRAAAAYLNEVLGIRAEIVDLSPVITVALEPPGRMDWRAGPSPMIQWYDSVDQKFTREEAIGQLQVMLRDNPSIHNIYYVNRVNWDLVNDLLATTDPKDARTISIILDVMRMFIRYEPGFSGLPGVMPKIMSWANHPSREVRRAVKGIFDQIIDSLENSYPPQDAWNPFVGESLPVLFDMLRHAKGVQTFKGILSLLTAYLKNLNLYPQNQEALTRALTALNEFMQSDLITGSKKRRTMMLDALYPNYYPAPQFVLAEKMSGAKGPAISEPLQKAATDLEETLNSLHRRFRSETRLDLEAAKQAYAGLQQLMRAAPTDLDQIAQAYETFVQGLTDAIPEGAIRQHIQRLDGGRQRGWSEFQTYRGFLKDAAAFHERYELMSLMVDFGVDLMTPLDLGAVRHAETTFLAAHREAAKAEAIYISLQARRRGVTTLDSRLLDYARPVDLVERLLVPMSVRDAEPIAEMLEKDPGFDPGWEELTQAIDFMVHENMIPPNTSEELYRKRILIKYLFLKLSKEFEGSKTAALLGNDFFTVLVLRILNVVEMKGYNTFPDLKAADFETAVRSVLTRINQRIESLGRFADMLKNQSGGFDLTIDHKYFFALDEYGGNFEGLNDLVMDALAEISTARSEDRDMQQSNPKLKSFLEAQQIAPAQVPEPYWNSLNTLSGKWPDGEDFTKAIDFLDRIHAASRSTHGFQSVISWDMGAFGELRNILDLDSITKDNVMEVLEILAQRAEATQTPVNQSFAFIRNILWKQQMHGDIVSEQNVVEVIRRLAAALGDIEKSFEQRSRNNALDAIASVIIKGDFGLEDMFANLKAVIVLFQNAEQKEGADFMAFVFQNEWFLGKWIIQFIAHDKSNYIEILQGFLKFMRAGYRKGENAAYHEASGALMNTLFDVADNLGAENFNEFLDDYVSFMEHLTQTATTSRIFLMLKSVLTTKFHDARIHLPYEKLSDLLQNFLAPLERLNEIVKFKNMYAAVNTVMNILRLSGLDELQVEGMSDADREMQILKNKAYVLEKYADLLESLFAEFGVDQAQAIFHTVGEFLGNVIESFDDAKRILSSQADIGLIKQNIRRMLAETQPVEGKHPKESFIGRGRIAQDIKQIVGSAYVEPLLKALGRPAFQDLDGHDRDQFLDLLIRSQSALRSEMNPKTAGFITSVLLDIYEHLKLSEGERGEFFQKIPALVSMLSKLPADIQETRFKEFLGRIPVSLMNLENVIKQTVDLFHHFGSEVNHDEFESSLHFMVNIPLFIENAVQVLEVMNKIAAVSTPGEMRHVFVFVGDRLQKKNIVTEAPLLSELEEIFAVFWSINQVAGRQAASGAIQLIKRVLEHQIVSSEFDMQDLVPAIKRICLAAGEEAAPMVLGEIGEIIMRTPRRETLIKLEALTVALERAKGDVRDALGAGKAATENLIAQISARFQGIQNEEDYFDLLCVLSALNAENPALMEELILNPRINMDVRLLMFGVRVGFYQTKMETGSMDWKAFDALIEKFAEDVGQYVDETIADPHAARFIRDLSVPHAVRELKFKSYLLASLIEMKSFSSKIQNRFFDGEKGLRTFAKIVNQIIQATRIDKLYDNANAGLVFGFGSIGETMAPFGVIDHELTHIILSEDLGYGHLSEGLHSASVHEFIADLAVLASRWGKGQRQLVDAFISDHRYYHYFVQIHEMENSRGYEEHMAARAALQNILMQLEPFKEANPPLYAGLLQQLFDSALRAINSVKSVKGPVTFSDFMQMTLTDFNHQISKRGIDLVLTLAKEPRTFGLKISIWVPYIKAVHIAGPAAIVAQVVQDQAEKSQSLPVARSEVRKAPESAKKWVVAAHILAVFLIVTAVFFFSQSLYGPVLKQFMNVIGIPEGDPSRMIWLLVVPALLLNTLRQVMGESVERNILKSQAGQKRTRTLGGRIVRNWVNVLSGIGVMVFFYYTVALPFISSWVFPEALRSMIPGIAIIEILFRVALHQFLFGPLLFEPGGFAFNKVWREGMKAPQADEHHADTMVNIFQGNSIYFFFNLMNYFTGMAIWSLLLTSAFGFMWGIVNDLLIRRQKESGKAQETAEKPKLRFDISIRIKIFSGQERIAKVLISPLVIFKPVAALIKMYRSWLKKYYQKPWVVYFSMSVNYFMIASMITYVVYSVYPAFWLSGAIMVAVMMAWLATLIFGDPLPIEQYLLARQTQSPGAGGEELKRGASGTPSAAFSGEEGGTIDSTTGTTSTYLRTGEGSPAAEAPKSVARSERRVDLEEEKIYQQLAEVFSVKDRPLDQVEAMLRNIFPNAHIELNPAARYFYGNRKEIKNPERFFAMLYNFLAVHPALAGERYLRILDFNPRIVPAVEGRNVVTQNLLDFLQSRRNLDLSNKLYQALTKDEKAALFELLAQSLTQKDNRVMHLDHHYDFEVLATTSTTILVIDFLQYLHQKGEMDLIKQIKNLSFGIMDHSDADTMLANFVIQHAEDAAFLAENADLFKDTALLNDYVIESKNPLERSQIGVFYGMILTIERKLQSASYDYTLQQAFSDLSAAVAFARKFGSQYGDLELFDQMTLRNADGSIELNPQSSLMQQMSESERSLARYFFEGIKKHVKQCELIDRMLGANFDPAARDIAPGVIRRLGPMLLVYVSDADGEVENSAVLRYLQSEAFRKKYPHAADIMNGALVVVSSYGSKKSTQTPRDRFFKVRAIPQEDASFLHLNGNFFGDLGVFMGRWGAKPGGRLMAGSSGFNPMSGVTPEDVVGIVQAISETVESHAASQGMVLKAEEKVSPLIEQAPQVEIAEPPTAAIGRSEERMVPQKALPVEQIDEVAKDVVTVLRSADDELTLQIDMGKLATSVFDATASGQDAMTTLERSIEKYKEEFLKREGRQFEGRLNTLLDSGVQQVRKVVANTISQIKGEFKGGATVALELKGGRPSQLPSVSPDALQKIIGDVSPILELIIFVADGKDKFPGQLSGRNLGIKSTVVRNSNKVSAGYQPALMYLGTNVPNKAQILGLDVVLDQQEELNPLVADALAELLLVVGSLVGLHGADLLKNNAQLLKQYAGLSELLQGTFVLEQKLDKDGKLSPPIFKIYVKAFEDRLKARAVATSA